MTDELDVYKLEAGKELDELVAVHVMGWIPPEDGLLEGTWNALYERNGRGPMDGQTLYGFKHEVTEEIITVDEMNERTLWATPEGTRLWTNVYDFSFKIEHAMQVLEKIYERTKHAKLRLCKWEEFEGRVDTRGPWGFQVGEGNTLVFANTAALAICRGALQWVYDNVDIKFTVSHTFEGSPVGAIVPEE